MMLITTFTSSMTYFSDVFWFKCKLHNLLFSAYIMPVTCSRNLYKKLAHVNLHIWHAMMLSYTSFS